MNKIKILICDDVPHICRHFEKIIGRREDMEVVGTANSGREIVGLAAELNPDIILMDIQLETEEAGIEATDIILKNNPSIKVIMLTVHKEDDLIFKSYGAGAVDYIIKTEPEEDVIASIRNVYNNEIFIRPNIAKKILGEFSKLHRQKESILYTITLLTSLTNSELEILKLLYSGGKRAEIADKRNVELVTINTQIRNILKKLGYKSTKEMIQSLKNLKVFESLDF